MSVLAVLFVQTQPFTVLVDEAKNFSRLLGMWLAVLELKRTTSKTVRMKLGLKLLLITVLVPVPVVGTVPSMLRSTMLPWVLQPNRFWPDFGVQVTPLAFGVQEVLRHVAEWNFSAMYLATEKGKMTFGP